MKLQSLFKWLLATGAGISLSVSVADAAYPPAAQYVSSPVPPNQARIWFYREANPYDSTGTPYVRLNGTVVGVSAIIWGEIQVGNFSSIYGLAIALAGFPAHHLWKRLKRNP